MFGIGPMELVLILVVALLVLGPKRMPELARTLGRGLSEFRKASNDLRQSLALEDLQNELRDGLSDKTIHRPAQAGDDLAPGKTAAAKTAGAAAGTAGAAQGSSPDAAADAPNKEATSASDSGNTAQAEARKPHPGELPLDNATEHHDVPDEGDELASPSPTRGGPSDPSSPAGVKGTAADTDSDLGNVPVGGAFEPADKSRG